MAIYLLQISTANQFIIQRYQPLLFSSLLLDHSITNQDSMISTKKLIKMARKWQRVAAIGRRRRISIPRAEGDVSRRSRSSSVADRGYFVVYTADQRRFAFPIAYLNHEIIRGLLELSEEEFGLPSDGPITLPCDAALMEYVVSLIPRRTSKEMQEALLASIANNGRCSLSRSLLHHQQKAYRQSLVCSF